MGQLSTYFEGICTSILLVLIFLSFKRKYEKISYLCLTFLYFVIACVNTFITKRYTSASFDMFIAALWMLNYRQIVRRDEDRAITRSTSLHIHQRHLRTFNNVIVEAVFACDDKTGKFGYVYGIYTVRKDKLIDLWKTPVKIMYDTYEEALEHGIKIAVEVINTSYKEQPIERNKITQGT